MQVGDPSHPEVRRVRLLAFLVILAALVAFHNSVDGAFLLDDFDAIHNNTTIRHLWPPWSALQPPRETSVAGRPLVNLSLAVNFAIHGLNPRGYHIVNIAIHAAAALTLFGLLRRLLQSPNLAGRFERDADFIAAMVAVLWAVHPLQTESVTYIVQRAESLCGLIYLFTLYSFARSMASPRPARWQIACVIACFTGMACKEIMVTTPLLVLLVDRALYARSFREAITLRGRLYLGLAASWIILAFLLAGTPRPTSAGSALPYGPIAYLRTEAGVILHYLRLSIWPDPLILDYNWPISPSWAQAMPAFVAVVGLVVITICVWIRRPTLALPAMAFFLILVPTSSFYPILDAAFEHRMYLPLAPILLMIVLALRAVILRTPAMTPRSNDRALLAIAAIVALLLTVRTISRNALYADPVALWKSNLEHGGIDNPRAITNLSGAFLMNGQYVEAREAALHAVRLSTDNPEAYVNLCTASLRLGLVDEAINMGRIAVNLRNAWPAAHFNLGMAYRAADRIDDARIELEKARDLDPDSPMIRDALANLSAPVPSTDAVGTHPGPADPAAP